MRGYWDSDGDDKLALLEASWRAGHTTREIVHALKERFGGNVTRNAVMGKVSRMALPMHYPSNSWRGMDVPARTPSKKADRT